MIQRYYSEPVSAGTLSSPWTCTSAAAHVRLYTQLRRRNNYWRCCVKRTQSSFRCHYPRTLLLSIKIASQRSPEVTICSYIFSVFTDFVKPVLQAVPHRIVAGYTSDATSEWLQVGKWNYIDYTLKRYRQIQVVIIVLSLPASLIIICCVTAYGYRVGEQVFNTYAPIFFPSASVFLKVFHISSDT